MGAPIVSGMDASPVFEPSEHVFDAMTLAIEDSVVGDMDLAIDLRRDARGNAALDECMAEPVGIIPSVGQHCFGRRQSIEEHGGALVVAGLAFGQRQANGATAAIAHGMKFGSQAASAASDTAG